MDTTTVLVASVVTAAVVGGTAWALYRWQRSSGAAGGGSNAAFASSLRALIIEAQTGFEQIIGEQTYTADDGDTAHATTFELVSSARGDIWRRTDGSVDFRCYLLAPEFSTLGSRPYTYSAADSTAIFKRKALEIGRLLGPSWIVTRHDLQEDGRFEAVNEADGLRLQVWNQTYPHGGGEVGLALRKT